MKQLTGLIDSETKKIVMAKFPELSSDELELRILEALKFLFLASKYPRLRGTFIPVTKEIDEIWHSMILETKYYESLCKKLPGGCFIHHATLPFDSYEGKDNPCDFVDEVVEWFSLYIKEFGSMQTHQQPYWYFIQAMQVSLGMSLDELNRSVSGLK